MKLEEYKNYVDKNIMSIMSKSNEEERDLLNVMIKIINRLCEKEQELITYLKEEIYTIEPKGCVINYDCEYDSEEDYTNGIKEKSRLETLKEILSKIEKE